MIYVVLGILIIYALSITLLTDFKAIESMFIAVMALIIKLLILLYFLGLTKSVYILCGFIVLTFIASVVYSIIRRNLLVRIKSFFINPAFLMLFIAVISYTVAIHGIKLLSLDNFSFWAKASKAILEYDGLRIPSGILSINHSVGLPAYYSFVTFFTGFRYDAMMSAMWFIYWVTLLLPFAKWDFKKLPILILFSMIAFSLLFSDYKAYTQLYADTIVTTVFTGVICYYYLNKDSKAKIPVILAGFIFFPQIKHGFGVIIAIFALIIIGYDIMFSHKHQGRLLKDNIKFVLLCTAGIFTSFIFSNTLIGLTKMSEVGYVSFQSMLNQILGNSTVSGASWCDPVGSVINAISSPLGASLLIALLIITTYITVRLILKKKIHIIVWGLFTLLVVGSIGHVFTKLDSGTIILIKEFFESAMTVKFLNIELPKLVCIVIGVCALLYIYVYKEDTKRRYLAILSIILTAQMILLVLVAIYRYSQFPISIVQTGNSMERYLGIYVYFVLYSITAIVLGKCSYHSIMKKKHMVYILTVILLLITIYPAPLQIYNQSRNSQQEYVENGFAQNEEYALEIKETVSSDDKLCIMVDKANTGGGTYSSLIISYFTLTSMNYIITPDYTKNIDEQILAIQKYYKENNITKVFLFGCYSKFFEEFNHLFLDIDNIETDKLYNVVWISDSECKLVPYENN